MVFQASARILSDSAKMRVGSSSHACGMVIWATRVHMSDGTLVLNVFVRKSRVQFVSWTSHGLLSNTTV